MNIVIKHSRNNRRYLYLVLAVYFAIALFFGLVVFRENLDIAWLTLAAERMLAGGTYTNSFMETNPPMAILAYVPIVLLEKWFAINTVVATYLYVSALIIIAMALIARLLSRFDFHRYLSASFFVLLIAAILFFAVGGDFGQREHIGFILVIPFVILIAVRNDDEWDSSQLLTIVITAIATLGCLVKPTMLLLVGLLLAYELIRCRRLSFVWGVESLTFGSIVMAYLLAIYAGVWNYDQIVVYLPKLYSVFNEESSVYLPKVTFLVIVYLLLYGIAMWLLKHRSERKVVHVISVAYFASIAGVLVQQKGWAYHLIPSLGLMTVLFVYLVALLLNKYCTKSGWWGCERKIIFPIILAGAAVTLLCLNMLVFSHNLRSANNNAVNEVFSELPKGTPVYVFSTDLHPAFPAVSSYDLVWSSRYAHQWILAGLENLRVNGEGSSNFYLQTEAMLKQTLVEDFECFQPTIVMVDTGSKMLAMDKPVDYVKWYSHDAGFRSVWSHYRLDSTIGKFDVYRRDEKTGL